ncbi:MAG: polysaccharide biosynthesis C-terminal domain-containing protein [Ruminococcus sp.]|nr:polysaccharide biosynthesis C-terminal domain-containing protein [Ruminococcus sp.]
MNKYNRHAPDTLIFATGGIGAEIISLLLNNLYTKYISPTGLFTKSLLEMLALILIPVFSFSITEAVVKYCYYGRYSRKQIFTTAFTLNIAGLMPIIIIVPFIKYIPFFRAVNGFSVYLMIYIFTSSLRALCSHFTKARGMKRLFYLDGVLTVIAFLLFNIIFISFLRMGVRGFMLSAILSDICSAGFLFLGAELKKFYNGNYFTRRLGKSMLRFTIPLVPTTVLYIFTEFSGMIFTGNMKSDIFSLGADAAGIYAAASQIPNLISILSVIFLRIPSVRKNTSAGRNISGIFSAYEGILFTGSAVLLIFIKPISSLFINYSVFPEYSTAYLYTPLLIAAAVFACLDFFIAGIYAKKNDLPSVLTVCIINIILNVRLIPSMGIQGAALSAFLSCLLRFLIRIIALRRKMPFKLPGIILNTVLLLLMCADVILKPVGYIAFEVILFIIIFIGNSRPLIKIFRK